MGRLVGIAVVIAFWLAPAPARAQGEPSCGPRCWELPARPMPVDRDVTVHTWYGWQTLLADVALTGAVVVSAEASDPDEAHVFQNEPHLDGSTRLAANLGAAILGRKECCHVLG